MSKAVNQAVSEAFEYGLLKSVSLMPNGIAFDEAVNNVIPKCRDLGVGIHLNITNGISLCSDINLLTDEKQNFNNSYWKILIKAYNPKETEFLQQVEREFRRQIEKVLSKTKVSHIDSHSHIHSIPKIFDLVCKLAKEYGIPQVRTHFEKFYFIPDPFRHFNLNYCKNFIKKFILNFFTIINENTVHKYELKTNDYLIGTSYNSDMDALAIAYGIKVIKYNNVTVEAFLHPHRYEEGTVDNYFDEYIITKNKKLADKIVRLGYDITNYVEQKEENNES